MTLQTNLFGGFFFFKCMNDFNLNNELSGACVVSGREGGGIGWEGFCSFKCAEDFVLSLFAIHFLLPPP